MSFFNSNTTRRTKHCNFSFINRNPTNFLSPNDVCEWKSLITDNQGRGGGVRRCNTKGDVNEILLYNELTGTIPSGKYKLSTQSINWLVWLLYPISKSYFCTSSLPYQSLVDSQNFTHCSKSKAVMLYISFVYFLMNQILFILV